MSQQQQLPVGASTQLSAAAAGGAHSSQTREALAVRSLIVECVQLVKLLRTLYQWRAAPAALRASLDQLGQRDTTDAQMLTAIRQVHADILL